MFHLYGLIIGVAAAIGFLLSEKKARQYGVSEEVFWSAALWIGVGGVIGARAYHVWTDFQLYRFHLIDVLRIWNGGLSIIGAVIGGCIAAAIFLRWKKPQHFSLLKMFDIAVFGLPFAQAIGRLGNFVNQELYGLPSNLPWAIYIHPQHRLPGFEQFSRFHPLFAYEMVATVAFGIFIWWWDARHPSSRSGQYFWWYLLYYSAVRFLLDFLRIDKALFLGTALGLNQVVLLLVVIFVLLRKKIWSKKFLFLALGASVFFAACQKTPSQIPSHFSDHQKITITLHDRQLTFEVVTTPASWTQGLSDRTTLGSDGMLFLLPNKAIQQFWMKGMKFGLDFLWINDFQVADVTKNIPPPFPSIPDGDLPVYAPSMLVNMVLEMNAGAVEKYGIVPGDRIKFQ